MRYSALVLLPLLLSALTAVYAADAPAEPRSDEEAQYGRVLNAYRGELTTDQLADLEAVDPGPSLYLDSERASERALVRLFATLPDEAHARLRREGVLKWKVAALPETQRGWVGDLAVFLEALGEGPFPVQGRKTEKRSNKVKQPELMGKTDQNGTETGFVKVDVPGQDQPSYSWWISAPGAKRAAWLTLVHAVGLATREWQVAHRLRLEEIHDLPESPSIPSEQWQKYRETKRSAKPTGKVEAVAAPRYFEDAVYDSALKVYRGRHGAVELGALKVTDPDLESRLKSSDPLAQAARTLFVRLSDKEHEALRAQGVIRWYSQDLSKDQLRILEPAVEELNRRGMQAGEGDGSYSLAKFSGTCVGFSILEMPGVDVPVLSWWVRSRRALNPTWVTLINTAAAKNAGYYRAHLIEIGGVQ